MTDRTPCPNCDGSGWICETHPDRPWEGTSERACTCGGAGTPYALCNPSIKFTYSVWDCSKPVLAMIDGFCLAGALEFAMCCDMRFCSDDSSFAALEARFSNGIATMIMPWIIGQKSRALIYTGDTIKADEAFRIGLVDKVFPKNDLRAEVMKVAKRMSRVSVECLQWNKRAINHTFETMGLRNAIAYGAEACALMDSISSPEAAQFDSIRREQGMSAALKWRTEQFAPFE